MSITRAITGNGAVAEAMRQINPDVVAAFPITPSTQIVEDFSRYAADGRVDTEFIAVESEHSAMSACIGAAAAGGRVMTATASAGMALMWELLYVAASMRQSVVMALVNRALSGPINIHADHGDSMGARDAGWIQLYSENNQEAYDNMLMAPRIAEDPEVRLPVMVCQDGFIISHCVQTMLLEADGDVKDFVGGYVPMYPLLDTAHPVSMGALDLQDYYFEHKRGQYEAIIRAKDVILTVAREFEKKFGRSYGLFEEYRCSGADHIIVALSSAAGEIKEVVDELRLKGRRVGLLKIRLFRPFPYREVAEVLAGAKIVTVLDRSCSFGGWGPLFTEVRAALYDGDAKPLCRNRIFGLGGRDLLMEHVREIFADESAVKPFDFLGVRGG